jgi:hypothetical protein
MVDTVRVAVPAPEPVISIGLVDPKLETGMSWAPAGLAVTATVNPTAPVNPPLGVMVIVDVFPAVAPGTTVIAVPPMIKEGAVPPMV